MIDNKGAIVHIDESLKVKFKFLLPSASIDRTSMAKPKNKELYPKHSGDDEE